MGTYSRNPERASWSDSTLPIHQSLFTSGAERGFFNKALYINTSTKLNINFFFVVKCRKSIFFFPPLSSFYTASKAHWPGSSLCLPTFGQWRGFRENNTTINQKRRGDKGKRLSCGLDRAFPCKVPWLATAVTVDFTRLAAVDGDVTSFATPRRGN